MATRRGTTWRLLRATLRDGGSRPPAELCWAVGWTSLSRRPAVCGRRFVGVVAVRCGWDLRAVVYGVVGSWLGAAERAAWVRGWLVAGCWQSRLRSPLRGRRRGLCSGFAVGCWKSLAQSITQGSRWAVGKARGVARQRRPGLGVGNFRCVVAGAVCGVSRWPYGGFVPVSEAWRTVGGG